MELMDNYKSILPMEQNLNDIYSKLFGKHSSRIYVPIIIIREFENMWATNSKAICIIYLIYAENKHTHTFHSKSAPSNAILRIAGGKIRVTQ